MRCLPWLIRQRMRIQTAKNQSMGQETTMIVSIMAGFGLGWEAGLLAYAAMTAAFWALGKWWLDHGLVTIEQKIALEYNEVQKAIYDSATANLAKRNARKNEDNLSKV